MSQVLMEILPNIHVGNIYITLPDISDSCRDVVVKKSECVVQLQSGNEVCLKLPRGICLAPDEVRCIKQEEQVITVRVQLDERTSLINTLASDLMSDSDECAATPLSSTLSDTVLSGHCKLCKHQLLEHVKFQRVLPLPSVDWEQASEDWFCHIHKEDGQRLKPTSLQPEEGECFYTELFFLVHHNLMEHIKPAKPSNGPEINCVKCNLSLGMLVNQSLKLWTHNLVWKEEEGTVHSTDVAAIMLTLFHNIERDNFCVNCRLVLQQQTVPRRYLYMVTMNTNQKLLISEDYESLHSGGCLREKQCEEDQPEGGCVAVKRARGSGRPEVRVRAVLGVKLLYAEKEGDDEESGEWSDSVHVHLLPCDDTFFSGVKTLLEATNRRLPENIKHIENMKVGYIIK